MKLPLLILLFLIPYFSGMGQASQAVQQEDKSGRQQTVYNIVEKMPMFPGGEPGLLKFLGDNIRYPAAARNQNIAGTVYLSFVVNAFGDIKDITILRGISEDLDNEAVRVMKLMPKWIPGEHSGKTVPVRYNLPVKFILAEPVVSTANAVSNANKGDESYRNGIQAFNESKYADAARLMTEAIRYTCSNDLDALFIRGCAFYNIHDSAAACADWKICYHRNDQRAAERLQMHCGCFYDPDKKIVYFEKAAEAREIYLKKKESEVAKSNSNMVYTRVDRMPKFPGGDVALQNFLQRNIRYPESSRQNNISGTVYLTFVVDTAGLISHIMILKGTNSALDDEAVRVVRLMPPWECGQKNGKAVNVQFNLPIRFDLKEIPR